MTTGPTDGNLDAPNNRLLLQVMAQQGLTRDSEAGLMVFGWLSGVTPRSGPVVSAECLAAAVTCARSVYDIFNQDFNAYFMEANAQGRDVEARLYARFHYTTDEMVESVLERIRDRRLRLLDDFRQKFQPALFGPLEVDPDKVRGYLVRVAEIESLHVPRETFRNHGVLPRSDALAAPVPEEEEEEGATATELHRLAGQLARFYGPANGFTDEQRLEGLVSLGLGFATGQEQLAERCGELLKQLLPAWREAGERMGRLASRLTARWEEAKRLRDRAAGDAERAEHAERLAEIEARQIRVQGKLARHATRLRPRPGDVKRLLAGFVINGSNVRFRRIRHEIAVLERRVRDGRIALLRPGAPALPPEVLLLLADMHVHLGTRPPNARAQKLPPAEKQRRVEQTERWRDKAGTILGRTRCLLATLHPNAALPPALFSPAGFLADLEDFYELGLLTRKGVLWGLGRRHGWRLDRLLRS